MGWKLAYDRATLSALAAELGSDVPFFLADGPAICQGRGELVAPITRPALMHFALVRPPEGLSTAAVYRACQPAVSPRSLDALRAAMARGDWSAVGGQLFNRLQSTAAAMSAYVRQLRERIRPARLLGPCDEREWFFLFWSVPQRPPCTAGGAASASKKLGERVRCS